MSVISVIGSFLLKALVIVSGVCGVVIFTSIIIGWILVEAEKSDKKLADELREMFKKEINGDY